MYKRQCLIIVGEGPERDRIETETFAWGVERSVLMPGFMADPAAWVGHFDIFALSSDSEQFPISLVEAMAAGLPVAAPAVGDIDEMVSEENRPLISPAGEAQALSGALAALAHDAGLRARLGQANRTAARARFDETPMIEAYRRLYASAMGRASLP